MGSANSGSCCSPVPSSRRRPAPQAVKPPACRRGRPDTFRPSASGRRWRRAGEPLPVTLSLPREPGAPAVDRYGLLPGEPAVPDIAGRWTGMWSGLSGSPGAERGGAPFTQAGRGARARSCSPTRSRPTRRRRDLRGALRMPVLVAVFQTRLHQEAPSREATPSRRSSRSTVPPPRRAARPRHAHRASREHEPPTGSSTRARSRRRRARRPAERR